MVLRINLIVCFGFWFGGPKAGDKFWAYSWRQIGGSFFRTKVDLHIKGRLAREKVLIFSDLSKLESCWISGWGTVPADDLVRWYRMSDVTERYSTFLQLRFLQGLRGAEFGAWGHKLKVIVD